MKLERNAIKLAIAASFLLLASLPTTCAAQNVVGVSEILNSTSSSEIDTYSATEIDYQTSLYYGAYVEGYLYQNGTLIADGSASDPSNAYGYMSKPVQVSSQYQLESDHYLVATYVYASSGGTTYWYNPDEYLISTGGSSYPSTGSFAPGGGPIDYTTQYLYLGSTGVQMSSAAPTISSINPTSGKVGSSGTITVYGSNLVDVFTQTATASITGSGVSLSVQSANASQVVLNYSIATNASTGNQNLTLSSRFGTSNTATFTVADPTPVVSSVSPGTWNAGATTQITISGKGFGTNPSLSITGPGVSGSSIVSSSDTQITANVTVAANSSGGTATVQVQSNGYTGNGFLGTGGQSSQGSNTAFIQFIPAPPPQIMFQGTNVALTTQSIVVGQQIALTVPTTNVPSGLTVQSQSWSGITATSAVGGYNASASSGQVVQMPAMSGSGVTFYWITQGNQTVRYTWTLSNGQSNSATVSFTVGGPTGNLLLTANMPTDGSGVQVLSGASGPRLGTIGTVVPGGQVGIAFTSNATIPSGYNQSVTWVQLVTNQFQYVNSKGPVSLPASPQTGLDNTYPYTNVSATTTYDSPATSLPSTYGEGWETFTAIMYLMWDPGLPGGCSPAKTVQNPDGSFSSTASTCTSIPIPLSSVTWHWSGCAINTLTTQSNGTTWMKSTANGCPVETLGSAQSAGFPVWTSAIQNH